MKNLGIILLTFSISSFANDISIPIENLKLTGLKSFSITKKDKHGFRTIKTIINEKKYENFFYCFTSKEIETCIQDDDGGRFTITQKKKKRVVRIEFIRIGDLEEGPSETLIQIRDTEI